MKTATSDQLLSKWANETFVNETSDAGHALAPLLACFGYEETRRSGVPECASSHETYKTKGQHVSLGLVGLASSVPKCRAFGNNDNASHQESHDHDQTPWQIWACAKLRDFTLLLSFCPLRRPKRGHHTRLYSNCQVFGGLLLKAHNSLVACIGL